MEDINIYMCLFLIVTGFIAAFIDTVVGGGGLISLPALLFTGMPPVTAIATNTVSYTHLKSSHWFSYGIYRPYWFTLWGITRLACSRLLQG